MKDCNSGSACEVFLMLIKKKYLKGYISKMKELRMDIINYFMKLNI